MGFGWFDDAVSFDIDNNNCGENAQRRWYLVLT